MSATSNPFGFRPAESPIGNSRANTYNIASGYGTAMYKGQPVILNTNGTITAGTSAADIIGVFAGCEYVDSTGRPQRSTFWPASTTVLAGTLPVAYVWDDPNTVFEVQSDGSIAQVDIGDQCDVSNVSNANTTAGLSQCTLSATKAGAGSQGQFRILRFAGQVDNVVGDAFTVVQVQIARSQYIANKVAI
jgi:hypothetical protein